MRICGPVCFARRKAARSRSKQEGAVQRKSKTVMRGERKRKVRRHVPADAMSSHIFKGTRTNYSDRTFVNQPVPGTPHPERRLLNRAVSAFIGAHSIQLRPEFGNGTMTNNHLSSEVAREFAQENTGGASSVTTSIREIAEQKLDQLGRYIRAAWSIEEDDRWKLDEPR